MSAYNNSREKSYEVKCYYFHQFELLTSLTLLTGLFQSVGLFRSYTNFITGVTQRTKIIKLNQLYLYDMQTDNI